MADQVIPIQDIASLGVIIDTPSIALPPNAYSDIENIRFHSGAARKMEGEMDLELTIPAMRTVDYALYWKGPTNEYYVVILDNGNILTHLITDGVPVKEGLSAGTMSGTPAVWQHTLFNGGFNLIINNGVDVPHYLSDPIGSSNIAPLPNWDSYLSQVEVTTVTWDEFNDEIALGRGFDPSLETMLISITPRDTSIGIMNYRLTVNEDIPITIPVTLKDIDTDNVKVTPSLRTETAPGALPGDQISISIETNAEIDVRAGVIRAYGNLLVAGNLTEMNGTDIIRRLPGTIRTSDVAAPGVVPLNWNPFRVGANTADEFILSSTGVVQDMAELQGVMYVYTDDSIHGIQQTGNPTIPFQISTVTDSYGCNSLGAVMEFDGRHLVVGAQDIYVFAGHPGSISSIADGRIRHYAYEDEGVDTSNVRMVRNQKYDEIWIFTPGGDEEMLVWNYRSQAWTIRHQTAVLSGTQGIHSPLFTSALAVFEGDAIDKYTLYTFIPDPDDMEHVPAVTDQYISFVERMRLGLTPEFDTETLGATAMMYTSDDSVPLTITMRGSNRPGDNDGIMNEASNFMFTGDDDYKVDTRIHGRFINYKISDATVEEDGNLIAGNDKPWNITGYQLEIMKGGKR